MRFFIRLLVLFALAAGLAVGARFNPGNVVFFYPPYRVDVVAEFFHIVVSCFICYCRILFVAYRGSYDGNAEKSYAISSSKVRA